MKHVVKHVLRVPKKWAIKLAISSTIAATVLLASVGCASEHSAIVERSAMVNDSSGRTSPSHAGSTVPAFSVPWAQKFADEYRKAKSEKVRRILAKSRVDDADWGAVVSDYIACMRNQGVRATIDSAGGAGTTEVIRRGADDLKAEMICNGDIGSIASLHNELIRNPDHKDEAHIVAACLVTHKLAPSSYTAFDYSRDLEHLTFPVSKNRPEFSQCINDPLGLMAAAK